VDTIINELIFEKSDNSPKTETILPEELSYEPMAQFLHSGYFMRNALQIHRFLDEDKTIDIEKLELAIILLLEYMEFTDKTSEPIYIYLGAMDRYFQKGSITTLSDENTKIIVEESSFILGFCTAIAEDNASSRGVVVQFTNIER